MGCPCAGFDLRLVAGLAAGIVWVQALHGHLRDLLGSRSRPFRQLPATASLVVCSVLLAVDVGRTWFTGCGNLQFPWSADNFGLPAAVCLPVLRPGVSLADGSADPGGHYRGQVAAVVLLASSSHGRCQMEFARI